MKKYIHILVVLLICIGVSSCTKDSNELKTSEASIQYLGPSVNPSITPRTTFFLFSVTLKANSPMFVHVIAKSNKNERLKSEIHLLQVGEIKEIYIQRSGSITDRDYIESYSVQVSPANIALVPGLILPQNPGIPTKTATRYSER